MRFRDKVAVVTGAARGIGRSIAEALAREGADVVIADIDEAAAERTALELQATGRRFCAHAIDLRDLERIPGLMEQAVGRFGGVHILVNNAGVEFGGTFFEVTGEVWDAHMDVNLRAMFFTTQAAARWMKDHSGGAVVNIASVQGAIFSGRYIPYTASKSGVRGLTAAMAVALAPYGVRVNAVAPGWCETAMNKIVGEPEAVVSRLKLIPLGRIGQPADIASAVAFLASDDAAYMTGQVITVDGGRTLGVSPDQSPRQAKLAKSDR
jgi:NAD(P)-dependent dehydrogenase (short-subunit alcohol dehydrogenase family)